MAINDSQFPTLLDAAADFFPMWDAPGAVIQLDGNINATQTTIPAAGANAMFAPGPSLATIVSTLEIFSYTSVDASGFNGVVRGIGYSLNPTTGVPGSPASGGDDVRQLITNHQLEKIVDAIRTTQAKVGIDDSAVESSLDFRTAALEVDSRKRLLMIVPDENNTTDEINIIGTSVLDDSATGVASEIYRSNTNVYKRVVTPAGAGSQWAFGIDDFMRLGWNSELEFVVRIGADIDASQLYWGWQDAGILDMDSVEGAVFKFDFMDSDVNWLCISNDGSATPANITDTGISVDTDTEYKLKIVMTAGSIKFYIDDVLVATHTTGLPAAATDLDLVFLIGNGDSTSRTFDFAYILVKY